MDQALQSPQGGRSIFSIRDDVRDPSGVSAASGLAPGYNFTGSAEGHPVLYYRHKGGNEFLITADVYRVEGAPLYVILYCPLCRNSLKIAQDNKAIEWEPDGRARLSVRDEEITAALGVVPRGVLSVEAFQCAWEVEPTLRRSFGFAVCPWRVAIERNVVRDA